MLYSFLSLSYESRDAAAQLKCATDQQQEALNALRAAEEEESRKPLFGESLDKRQAILDARPTEAQIASLTSFWERSMRRVKRLANCEVGSFESDYLPRFPIHIPYWIKFFGYDWLTIQWVSQVLVVGKVLNQDFFGAMPPDSSDPQKKLVKEPDQANSIRDSYFSDSAKANYWLDKNKGKHLYDVAASERDRIRVESEAREIAATPASDNLDLEKGNPNVFFSLHSFLGGWFAGTPSLGSLSKKFEVPCNEPIQLDGVLIPSPGLGPRDFLYYYRLMYRQRCGPYRRFEHTHLVIRQTALTNQDFLHIQPESEAESSKKETSSSSGFSLHDNDEKCSANDLPDCLLMSEKGGDRSELATFLRTRRYDFPKGRRELTASDSNEFCRIEDVIVFSVFGEPIFNYIALPFLKALLRSRLTYFSDQYGGRLILEDVQAVK